VLQIDLNFDDKVIDYDCCQFITCDNYEKFYFQKMKNSKLNPVEFFQFQWNLIDQANISDEDKKGFRNFIFGKFSKNEIISKIKNNHSPFRAHGEDNQSLLFGDVSTL